MIHNGSSYVLKYVWAIRSEQVLETSQSWGTDKDMMYVVGATRSEQLSEIREIIPNHFLLVPGVGVQGGSVEEVAKYGMKELF